MNIDQKQIANILRHGEPQDVLDILAGPYPVDAFRLQLALINAFENIQSQRRKLEEMSRLIDPPPWE